MSIKELLKYEEGEEKLSDEELCQRWNQVFCEAYETAQSLPSCNSMEAYLTLRERLQRVLITNSVSIRHYLPNINPFWRSHNWLHVGYGY